MFGRLGPSPRGAGPLVRMLETRVGSPASPNLSTDTRRLLPHRDDIRMFGRGYPPSSSRRADDERPRFPRPRRRFMSWTRALVVTAALAVAGTAHAQGFYAS